MCFRPEDQHGASGKPDVVPPVSRRHAEMDNAFIAREFTVSYFQLNGLTAISTRCSQRPALLPENCNDAQRIPNADAVVVFAINIHVEPRGHSTEWCRDPNAAIVGRQDDDFR